MTAAATRGPSVRAYAPRAEARLRGLRTAVALAFVSGIALSPRLWLSDAREYPLAPVSQGLPHLGAPLDAVALGALVVSLVAVAVFWRSRVRSLSPSAWHSSSGFGVPRPKKTGGRQANTGGRVAGTAIRAVPDPARARGKAD